MSTVIWIVAIAVVIGLIVYLVSRRSRSGMQERGSGADYKETQTPPPTPPPTARKHRTLGESRGSEPPEPEPPSYTAPEDFTHGAEEEERGEDRTANGGGTTKGKHIEVRDEDKDEVICSVYAPSTMQRGMDELVQVFMHLLEQAEEVAVEAQVLDPAATYRGKTYLSAKLASGDAVQVWLKCDDVEIDESVQSAIWNQRPTQIAFGVHIPEDMPKSRLIFQLEVYHDTVPVGKLAFRVEVAGSRAVQVPPVEVRADQFEHAFISYASKDRDEVLKRVQGIKATKKYRIFQDVMVLEMGDQWEPRLEEEIRKCDVFFLFWSQNAKDSKWVKKEFILAYQRKQGDNDALPRIQPVPIHLPLVDPWEDLRLELGEYHLNDQVLYFISDARE